jgi:hypothetical protein
MTVPRPERLVKIENWSVHPSTGGNPYRDPATCRTHLVGEVYGYPGRPDGHRVETGNLYGVDGRVVWGRRTAYLLGEPSPDYVAWLAEHGFAPIDPDAPIRIVPGDDEGTLARYHADGVT